MSETTVRPARPEDRDLLVWVMRTASTSHLPRCIWDVLLDMPSDEVDGVLARLLFSEQPHWCHLSRFTVAERDGEPVGAMSAFDAATEGAPALEAAFASLVGELGLSEEQLQGIGMRVTTLARATPPEIDGAWGLEALAVRPEARSSGAVRVLADNALTEGRARGYRLAELLYLIGNTRVEPIWAHWGFTLQSDYRDVSCEQMFGMPGLRMFVRAL